jgi:hypothetical protein
VRLNGGGEKAEWATAYLVTSGTVLRRGQPMWTMATSAEHSPCGDHSHQEQGRRVGPGDHPGRSNGNGPLTYGPGPLNNFSNFQTPLKLVNSKRRPTIFEYFEQLSPLGRVQILNRIHVINNGTEFNLNLP